MNNRNIQLGYILIGLNSAFFWYAPWLLYLLKFITLQEAAILQAIGMVISIVAEVPSGALSDLIGKKKTLILAFLFTAIGELTMAFSSTFPSFVITWIVMNIGYSFSSGTMEAYMYDTLVSVGNQHQYSRVVSRMQLVKNAVIAPASIIGGFMFSIWAGLPFFATGITKLIGFVIAFFLVEPAIDTETFSIKGFVRQTSRGLNHLFQRQILKYTILLLIYGVFMITAYEFLDDISIVDWGYNEVEIGFIYAGAIAFAIPASYLYERASKLLGPSRIIVLAILLLSLNYILSPWINAVIWTLLFFLRVFFSPLKDSAISELLNHNTPSNIRATTLSTYELLRKIPYVLLAGAIGTAMEIYGVRWFSHYFALTLIMLTGLYFVIYSLKIRGNPLRFTRENSRVP